MKVNWKKLKENAKDRTSFTEDENGNPCLNINIDEDPNSDKDLQIKINGKEFELVGLNPKGKFIVEAIKAGVIYITGILTMYGISMM